jgi:membrane-anchored protein YejM (alkaline phosphatase superfamily)
MVTTRKAKHKTPEPPQKLEISEGEQWRLINETGILKDDRNIPVAEQEDTPLAEEIFGAVTLIIPFSFVLFLFDLCVFFPIR